MGSIERPTDNPYEALYPCDFCGEPISEGETYIEDDGTRMCQTCLDNVTVGEMLKALGIDVKTARVPL